MYRQLNLILFFILASFLQTQAQKNKSVLSAPENWKGEIIPFPISFAPDIPYTGFEDLRFAPHWSDSTSQEFWTYMFVWYIKMDSPLTESKLTDYFNQYYDGLMGIDIHNQEDSARTSQLDKTSCAFRKTSEGFTGIMNVFDAFFSKRYMVLYIKVRESFCPKKKKQIIICEISRQTYDHEVWDMFKSVSLKVKCK